MTIQKYSVGNYVLGERHLYDARLKDDNPAPDASYPKGVLGYRSDDVENYVEAAEAKDRIRQITRTHTDDFPARKAMWDQLEKQKPLLAEYYSLINDPDALIRKAQEVKDAQLRNTMYALARAALGGNLVSKQFSYEDSPAGRECVVVGIIEFSGEHRAVHILPNGRVFSTDFYCQDRKIVIFLILILFCIISIIIFEMLY